MSNKTQQTAVEWLISQQKHNQFFDIETIEQAKEMEKEKIEKAYDDAIMKGRQEDGEQYYEQTYGGNK